MKIPLIMQPLEEFTREPITLGDHLRRRRIELGLYQKDVAAMLDVTASTIWNWEHGWPIGKRLICRIVRFLGLQSHTLQEPQKVRLQGSPLMTMTNTLDKIKTSKHYVHSPRTKDERKEK